MQVLSTEDVAVVSGAGGVLQVQVLIPAIPSQGQVPPVALPGAGLDWKNYKFRAHRPV